MKQVKKIDVAAALCCGVFIVILGIAGYFDRSIRLLHVFESMPYTCAATLVLRQHKFGYALGVAGGAFWLWTAGFLTSFIRNGFERLATLIHTGSVDRLDILIAAPAAIATGGLVLFSVAGYAQLPKKSWCDAGLLLGAAVLVALFFLAIFAAFAPQYLGMFRGILPRLN